MTLSEGAVRALLWLQAAGAGVFLALQPRGFAVGSRGFWEHQVVVPLFFVLACAAAGCPARWPRRRAGLRGALAGFWATCSAVIAGIGTTAFAHAMGGIFAAALALGALLLRREGLRATLGGALAGALLAAFFLFLSWAPPPSTSPILAPPPQDAGSGPPDRVPPKVRYSIEGRWIIVEHGPERLMLDPGFEFDSASASGLWTIFDFESHRLPPWTWSASGRGHSLEAAAPSLLAGGLVWREADGVHVRVGTRVAASIASHLSSVMTVRASGPIRVEEAEWPSDGVQDRATFIAFRGPEISLLRAARREKGPFETLGSWAPRDPWITMGAWRVQVRGWADQASREASPTAGWGVSQGAIERVGDSLVWSLAATSIGRGWHAVRTAPGTYILEAIITPVR